jgi:PAS domain S-box-containing protein
MNLLYVEDDPQDADLMQRELAQMLPDAQLQIVASLGEARERLAEAGAYDALLLDLSLPDGSGLDLLAELRTANRSLPIIVLTGSGNEEVAVAALKAGADDYLVKQPGYFARVPDLLSRTIERQRRSADRYSRPLRVLYAEHNAADIDLTRRHIARHASHIRLDVVHDVSGVLDRLPASPAAASAYDVLLLDYKLPGLNALDALKTIRQERGLTLPVVLVTGQGSEEVAVHALSLGAADYLVKHPGYLFELPVALENAYHYNELQEQQLALRNSEQRFRSLIEVAPDAIFTLQDNKIVFVNPAGVALLGAPSAADLVGRSIEDIVHPDNWEVTAARLQNLLAGVPDQYPAENRYLRLDGREVPVEVTAAPIIWEGRPAIQGIARDISQQKALADALRQREQDVTTLVNNATDFIVRVDRELRHLYVNRALADVTGIPVEEYLGKTNEELGMPPAQVALWNRELYYAVEKAAPHAFSFQFTGVDGILRHYEASITPEFDAAGEVSSLLAVVRDITARVAAEEQIRLQGAALDAAANGIIITDAEGIIQWVNPAFTTLTQYTLEEAVGRNPNELVKSGRQKPELYRQLWATILSGQIWQGELINRRKDGSLYYEEQTITPLHDETGAITHFVAIKQDITARRQNERARHLLLALSPAVSDAPSLESALEAALSLVCSYADWDLGEVWLPIKNPESDKAEFLELLAYYHETPAMDEPYQAFGQRFRFIPDVGLPGRVWASREPFWIADIAADSTLVDAQMATTLGFRVAMGLPITVDGAAVAVMCFFTQSPRQKDEQLVALMSGVATQMAAAFQRKQYQEKLFQSQQLAQTTIDALSAHIAVVDEKGLIIAVNRRWLNFAQTNGADMAKIGQGVNYLAVCATAAKQGDQAAAEVLAGIQTVMRGEQARFSLEYTCPMPVELRWFVVRVTPLQDGDPQRCRVVIAHEDITVRKQAEQALRDREEHYRLLFDSNPQPMWVYDLERLSFLAVNDAAIEKYGYSREEFLSMTLLDIRPPDEVELLLANVAQPRPVLQHSGEWRHQLRDGRLIQVEIISHAITFKDHAAALVVAFDITARKQAEEELQQSESRFRMLAEQAQDLVYRYRLQPSPGFEYVSPAATAITGYTPEEHYADPELGQKLVVAEDRHLLRAAAEAARLGKPLLLRWQRKDGRIIWTEQRNTPVLDDQGQLIALEGIARDVTEREEAAQALAVQAERQTLLAVLGELGLTGQDLSTLLQTAVNRLNHALELSCTLLWEWQQPQQALQLAYAAGPYAPTDENPITLSLEETSLFTAALQARDGPAEARGSLLSTDYPADEWLVRQGIVSGAAQLLHGRSGIYGVLAILSRRSNLTHQELTFLQQAANLLGLIVARSQAEEDLRQRLHQLNVQHEIDREILALRPTEEILHKTLGLAHELIPAAGAASCC